MPEDAHPTDAFGYAPGLVGPAGPMRRSFKGRRGPGCTPVPTRQVGMASDELPLGANELPSFPELAADYDILREIGRGGSAIVYLAREIGSDRSVAIKVLRTGHLQDPESGSRMAREAKTIGQLQHPNIVMLLGARRLADRGQALILQYIPGLTVKGRIRRDGPLPVPLVERILTDLGSALQYAHQYRIVHRDIKPENIFLDEDTGKAHLADFGIARFWDADSGLTLPGSALGTPNYMSPEQVDGKDLDGRSDLYSVGLVAWEMLTGRTPWEGETLYKVIQKQKSEELAPLHELRPDCPVYIRRAISRALHKDRNNRWRDAGEFLAALQNPFADLARTGRIPTLVTSAPAGSPPPAGTPSQAASRTAKRGVAEHDRRPERRGEGLRAPLRERSPSAEDVLESETVLLDPETLKRARSALGRKESVPGSAAGKPASPAPDWLRRLETGAFQSAIDRPRLQGPRRPPEELLWHPKEAAPEKPSSLRTRMARLVRSRWTVGTLAVLAAGTLVLVLQFREVFG